MIIRKFRKQDASDVCRLVSTTFKTFVASEFTKKGVKKFLEEQTPEKQIERSKTRNVLVAVSNRKIIGMIEGNGKDKVTRLFVYRQYHGKGIAKQMMNKLEKIYKKHGTSKIRVFSSLYAINFYKKMGYKKSTRKIRKNGFVYQPMRKILL
jgi:GNAT superfamily N-acetyltransferase